MSFFAILFALLIEQVRPLGRGNAIHAGLRTWARWASRNFDAGKPHHGWVAWALAVIGPAVVAALGHWALKEFVGWLAALAWSVGVLYVTLGFRQFSHHFTAIRDALDAGDEAQARELLAQWQQVEVHELPRSELLRHVIEYSVLAAHRHVFGVLACYSVFAVLGFGPAGAVNVRLGGEALRSAFASPSAAGYGAPDEPPADSESTPGREAEPGHLRSVVGLVWRSVVLWMVLLALLTLARLLG